MKFFLLLLSLMGFIGLSSQSSHAHLRSGDNYYFQSDFSSAEESYLKALEKKNSPKGSFNLGNSLFFQERYEQAAEAYQAAAESAETPLVESQAYYNLGNALFELKDIEGAIDAYKNAIRRNPNDMDAKKNLTASQIILKAAKKEEQQQCENPSESDSESQDQEQQEQEQQEQQESSESENQEQQEQQQSEQDSTQQVDLDSLSSTGQLDSLTEEQMDSLMMIQLSKEEADRLLRIAEDEERKVQEKLMRIDHSGKKPEKDW